jgi:hypothetical protein
MPNMFSVNDLKSKTGKSRREMINSSSYINIWKIRDTVDVSVTDTVDITGTVEIEGPVYTEKY